MKKTVFSVLFFLLVSLRVDASSPPKALEYRYLKAISCTGSYSPGGVYSEYLRAMRLKKDVEMDQGYVKAEREEIPSFFFSPFKLVSEEIECLVDDEEREGCILRNIIPVPLRSALQTSIEGSILAAMNTDRRIEQNSWSGAVLTDRNRGFLDNIEPILQRFGLEKAKKEIIEALRVRKDGGTIPSPYHALVKHLASQGLRITGLIIEVADTVNEVSLSLGAALLLSKKESASEWILKTNNYRELVREEKLSKDAKFVECYMDELMGLHLALGIPVIISDSLYSRVAVDGLIYKPKDAENMIMKCPYFDTEREQLLWSRQLEEARAKPSKAVLKVNEISDATTFLKMRLSEKRACLRSSGILALPRPREGPKRVDALMIPLLDEEVAYEVLRRLGETRGDFDMAAKMQDFESRKPKLARLYKQAMDVGDLTKARELVAEINSLATLAYDPSNPEDETVKGKGGFDIEEWYYEQRKRISISQGAVF